VEYMETSTVLVSRSKPLTSGAQETICLSMY
jgi:hypothetical protein